MAVDAAGNVYVADTSNHRIRLVTPSGATSTLAGNGMAAFANGVGVAANFCVRCVLFLFARFLFYCGSFRVCVRANQCVLVPAPR